MSNINKYKVLLNNGIVYGITSSLQSILGFILLPIITNYFTTEIFGAYSLILLLSTLASSIFYLGASSALGRFYYEIDSFDYRSNVISISILITLLGAGLLIILSIIFANNISIYLFKNSNYSYPIILSMIGTSLTFLTTLMSLILRYEKKAIAFLITTIFGTILNFIVTFFLLTKFNYGILSPIIGVLLSNGLIFLTLIIINRKFVKFKVKENNFFPMLSFGIQASITGLLYYILDWVDRIIIKNLLSISDVGIYSLGYRLATIINILLILPFTLIWAPMRMEYAKNTSNDLFVSKVVSYYSIIGISFILFSFLFGDLVFQKIFINNSFSPAMKIFPIIMFSLFIYGYQNILDFGIYLNKKVYIYIYISISGIILNVILNFAIIPLFGIIGAAISTLLTYFFLILLIYRISNKLHEIKIEFNRIFYPILFTIVCYIIILFNNSILIRITCLGTGIVLFFTNWLEIQEKKLISSKIKNLKNKII